jgi:transcriptional regulator with XRE-family HTH domain
MTNEFKAEVGQRIRQIRKEKQYTAKELGRLLGVAESTVIGYENGVRSPDLYSLARLADILGVTTDYLLGRKPVEAEYYKAQGRKEAWQQMMSFIVEELKEGS